MLKEFKQFIARGNVIDLAVGVIIGAAFTAIVQSLVTNLINPLIGLFVGRIGLSNLVLQVGDAKFKYGSFLNSVINFLIIAFVGVAGASFSSFLVNLLTALTIKNTTKAIIRKLITEFKKLPYLNLASPT